MTDQKIALRDRARRERSQKFIPCNFNVILKAPEIVAAATIASYVSYEFEPSTVEINEAFLRDLDLRYIQKYPDMTLILMFNA